MWILVAREGMLNMGHDRDLDIENNSLYKYMKQHERNIKAVP